MAFKPANANTVSNDAPREKLNFPTPEGGNQPARISLIVDLGTQEREDFEDPKTGEVKPQKPVQQLAIFADLVDNVVDYGGDVGEQHYRLMLNKNFKGQIAGVNFTAVPPRDADGNLISGKDWTFHPASLLTKLAKATGQTQILGGTKADNMDIEQLLGQGLMIDVEVKETPHKEGKKDDEGNLIVYKNVSPKVYATLPKVKGKAMDVEELRQSPLLITFDNVTEETAKFIRGDVKRQIQKALNYEGSQMQKVLGGASQGQQQAPKTDPEPSAEKEYVGDDFSDDLPFNRISDRLLMII